MLNIFAAFVEVTATYRHGSILPVFTPFSQTMDILSSTPLTPLGIFRKSSLPRAFWLASNVQLSVPVHSKSPLQQSDNQHLSACISSTLNRNGDLAFRVTVHQSCYSYNHRLANLTSLYYRKTLFRLSVLQHLSLFWCYPGF